MRGGAGGVAAVGILATVATGVFAGVLSVTGSRMTGGEAVAVGVVVFLAVCAIAVAYAVAEIGPDPDA